MCGIVGYIGTRDAYPILVKGLKRLEYRGYDSAGLALIPERETINIYKAKGKVSDLEHSAENKDISGSIGIAHTRWATHGEPNRQNAHPHTSMSGKLALVHNGIIENYETIKALLLQNGVVFSSSTDTEVLVHLIEFLREKEGVSLLTATQMALSKVTGAYAIVLIDRDNPDCIIAARKSSPMVIGIGEGEFFVASDAIPISEYTQKVVYLADNEIAILERGEDIKIVSYDNEEHAASIVEIDLSLSELEKGGYDHYMLKEIFEQPNRLTDCMRGRVLADEGRVVLAGVMNNIDKFKNARRIIIVACGTSWHAALIGEHLLESFCRIPVEVEYASEFRYREPVINSDDIVIALSQSGETADTLAAIELAKQNGAFVYGICNVVGSSIARATDSGTYLHVGSEIGVASTKAFTGQVTVLTMLAMILADIRGDIDRAELKRQIDALVAIPEQIVKVLQQSQHIQQLSQTFTYAHNFIYLGRRYNYPTALEGALKLKEISYIHAEGYPAAEMKHGPIALIDTEVPVVVIATNSSIYDKVVSNIQEIKARKGRIIAIVSEGDTQVKEMSDYSIEIPQTFDHLVPLLASIPLQLLAYFIAINKGRDVDQPRNLAKSVTVE